MEKTDHAAVVPAEMGWTDVGSWGALWDIAARDGDGNTMIGDVIATDSRKSYVRGDGRLIAVVGVEDRIVVDTADALLVAPRDNAHEMKAVVERTIGRAACRERVVQYV